MACKPGSVRPLPGGMAIPLGRPLPDASRDQPGRRRGNPLAVANGPKPAGPPAAPIRSCSRWGLPCRPRCRGRGALLPHRFTLAGGALRPDAGGLFSVALSLGLPPPGVTRHRVPVEPGLSSRRAGSPPPASGHPAIWRWSLDGAGTAANSSAQARVSAATRAMRQRVSPSATPSVRCGAQWRWKAATTCASVASWPPAAGT